MGGTPVGRHVKPSKSDEPASWLKSEFERTALPYSCLAEYLDLDKSAVTKILNGDRPLYGKEEAAARGYFTVVPPRYSDRFREAVGKLQSARARNSITSQLQHWLQVNEPAWATGISFARLIEGLTGVNATLRADQIVALCRVLRINIDGLAYNTGVQQEALYNWRLQGADAIQALSAEATKWAQEAEADSPYQFDRGSPYQFDRGRPSKIGSHSTGQSTGLSVRRGPRAEREFARCEPFVIDGDGGKPLFQGGQTIYVEHSPRDLRSGDIVIVFDRAGDNAIATIGYFQFETNDAISIDVPNHGRVTIPTPNRERMGRVNFCKFLR